MAAIPGANPAGAAQAPPAGVTININIYIAPSGAGGPVRIETSGGVPAAAATAQALAEPETFAVGVEATAVRLTRPQVLIRTKEVVAGTARNPADVMAQHVLRDAPLRFTQAGIEGLTPFLNERFEDVGVHLTINQVGDPRVKTVRDLRDLVWDTMPDEHKEPTP